ncbi:hypothetical protein SAMN04489727_6869 [Amycolatopsis tolypomycina]|uniref:Uncharacterized protein n=1 Tax=Amycolatopsis tolypomycina TaxID=208445 RepID=A0A1H4YQT4_9PSEU|nr:hypothetical protein SAMN04489727_6869 [Amycolatopsis tolypomycina]
MNDSFMTSDVVNDPFMTFEPADTETASDVPRGRLVPGPQARPTPCVPQHRRRNAGDP